MNFETTLFYNNFLKPDKYRIRGRESKTLLKMKTDNEKLIKTITLDVSIMDCFDNNEDLAVITGGKGILDKILDAIGIEVNGNNCGCNGNCGC